MAQQRKIKEYDAAIFVDDGGIDAFEFESNFIRFYSRDPADRERAWREAQNLWTLRTTQDRRENQSNPIRPPVLLLERQSA